MALRRETLATRAGMSDSYRAIVAEAIAMHVIALPEVAHASRVACYLSMASEPGTSHLLDALAARGVETLVPVSLADGTLDWAVFDGALVPGALGIDEPAGERLGVDALNTVDFVIAPALLIDGDGNRLGRGAGYYDRALAHTRAPVCALVYSSEVVAAVPTEPHDRKVNMVATEMGIARLTL
ncbi:5-formyltetrahydrofolate cyclo-ligase [soil metagenome]